MFLSVQHILDVLEVQVLCTVYYGVLGVRSTQVHRTVLTLLDTHTSNNFILIFIYGFI